MKKTLFTIALLSTGLLNSWAQNSNNKHIEIVPYWGSNWGMTTSLGVPAETREINSSALQYNIVLGADVTKMVSDKWGLTTGLRYERKANGSDVRMQNFKTTITLTGEGTPTSGYFSGRVKSLNDNRYLTVPVLAVYRINEKWDLRGGLYVSYAVHREYTSEATDGEIRETPLVPKTAVTYSTSDFSDDISRWDMGIQIGAVHPIWKQMVVSMDLNWGLLNVMDSPASGLTDNVYNIYLSVGLGWKF